MDDQYDLPHDKGTPLADTDAERIRLEVCTPEGPRSINNKILFEISQDFIIMSCTLKGSIWQSVLLFNKYLAVSPSFAVLLFNKYF